jgi:hypothetical protein
MDDREVVAAQLDREPRSPVEVVARCHLGLPVVIAVPPHLDDGTPFPTRFWLTCPLASRRIGRIESTGGVRQMERRIEEDDRFAEAHRAAMAAYAAERDALIEKDRHRHDPTGGVGGATAGVKCLHAHYAHHLARGINPVGAETAAGVEPLDCVAPCVAVVDDRVMRNPEWREPSR